MPYELTEFDEKVLAHRQEFNALWPQMWKKIGPIHDQESNLHLAARRSAWIVWLAARNDLPEGFFKESNQ